MKNVKRLYWAATGLTAGLVAFSGFEALLLAPVMASYAHLGFPNYFRVELGLAKLVGLVLLLLPVPPRLKEWVYAGFTINFVSAAVAHAAMGESGLLPLGALGLLLASYYTYGRLHYPVGTSPLPVLATTPALEDRRTGAAVPKGR